MAWLSVLLGGASAAQGGFGVGLPFPVEIDPAAWVSGKPFPFDGKDAPKAVLLARYPGGSEAFANDGDYLDDLQHRYGKRGLEVLALLPQRPGDGALAGREFSVAVDAPALARVAAGASEVALLLDHRGRLLWYGPLASGVAEWIERILDGGALSPGLVQLAALGIDARGGLEDYTTDVLRRDAATMIHANPRNPNGWALRLTVEWARDLDPAAARRTAGEAVKFLALDALPVARFVDMLLRTAPGDQVLLQQALMALTPVAYTTPHDMRVQAAYLRVLNGLGRKREATMLVERLAKSLPDRAAASRAELALAMASGRLAPLFADTATRMIESARREYPTDRTFAMIHYTVLARCRQDPKAAGEVLDELARTADGGLNNEAWYMMTLPPRRGRFDHVALAYAERMIAADQLSVAEEDTVAMALYRAGRLEDAIDHQRRAVAAGGGPNYERRLQLYERALEASRSRPPAPAASRAR